MRETMGIYDFGPCADCGRRITGSDYLRLRGRRLCAVCVGLRDEEQRRDDARSDWYREREAAGLPPFP